MKAAIALTTLLSAATIIGNIQPTQSAQKEVFDYIPLKVASAQAYSDASYAQVLRQYVNSRGLVNYTALQQNPKQLRDYIRLIGAVPQSTYTGWSENQKIAFLLNAYNALTLDSIISQQPLRGIRQIPGVWNRNRHLVAGRRLTLDDIEHQILRKEFTEPRIHAALVCAAMSCPPLRQEPYRANTLDKQLDDQSRRWINSQGLVISRGQNSVRISKIFDWFGDDWKKQYSVRNQFTGNDKQRATLNFISRYVSQSDREYLIRGQYRLSYLNYDWSLNQQK